MEILKFRLKGKTAFFKNPEVNTYYYFTYGNIHRVALLGLFGAILGYQGYNAQQEVYPEFYEKLKGLKAAVVPAAEYGCFEKKVQTFNNSVGYASQETGGNLIVKEQWLEKPEWQVYVLIQDEESRRLADAVMAHHCVYMPYLGKNDHPADLLEAEIITAEPEGPIGGPVSNLIPESMAEFDFGKMTFKYTEYLPVKLKETTNLYETEKMILTDAWVKRCEEPVYRDNEYRLMFF